MPREDFDIADQRQTALTRPSKQRQVEIKARRNHQLIHTVERNRVEIATVQGHLRILLGQGQRIGRLAAAVAHPNLRALGHQEAHDRPAGQAQTDHQTLTSGPVHQRTFSVARPTSTKIRVTIQKRTMILGSGQPLSSK